MRSGLVGRSYAMLFASAGYDVRVYDASKEQLQRAVADMEQQLSALAADGLQRGCLTVQQTMAHVTATDSLEDCVTGARYIQECVPEDKDLKRGVWQKIDDMMESSDVVMASSTSGIVPSLLSDHLRHRHRFLVAHPANPPMLNPMVELVPAPWTDPSAVAEARTLMEQVGQVPIVLKREIEGFVQARIQAAIFHVAWQLIAEDYVDPLDVETAMHEGVGAWYAFMGPFSAEHINANGWLDLCSKYAQVVHRVQQTFSPPQPMQGPAATRLARELERWTPRDRLAERCAWRDRCMAALLRLRQTLDREEQEAEQPVS
ncbi:hypothetical protein C0Q70_21597 [Pomacea canaliculata]|uniref:3-hydroxyacyl-CoA dehydrogenase NAD binding domain-containing protein n=1 Tax=Pomacea canaliculata TaxID=400727 RepID=A0A2T7NCY5_POMCA|nr:hypothetical protein C0Q70_21597 [Pomacea canaliculata]